jgi:hypothetical protein
MEYKVVDLKSEGAEPCMVTARSPEHAALVALGIELVRSGATKNLRARVYYQPDPEQPKNMVRLYSKVADTEGK